MSDFDPSPGEPVNRGHLADHETERYSYLSTTPARAKDWRLAGWVVGLCVLLFACAAPFVRMPLARVPAVISSYESALAIADLITATILFGKFSRLRSSALLALACGYLFSGFIIVSHTLTFPGIFSSTGLLGAGSQSTIWLWVFWQGGFPLFVVAYALLRSDAEVAFGASRPNPGWAVASAVAGVALLVCACTAFGTLGIDRLPVIIDGDNFSRLIGTGTSPALAALSVIALVMLWRRNRPTVLDVWVMVVMCAWLFDIAMSAMINSARYDLGWYVGCGYGLLAASFVLVVLLLETMWLHDRLAAAQKRLADRARDLEQSVRARTEELRVSHETLKSEASDRLEAEQELMRTRTFLDVIIDNVPAMLLLKDAKTGKVVYLNRAGEDLTGIGRDEMIGKSVHEVMPGVDAKLIELQDRQLIESGKVCELYENTIQTRRRGVRLVRTKKLAVPDEHGAPKFLLGFCEDVTEQRQTEEQLRHAQKMEALGQLTGGLAHDFNNLLAIIIGNLDVLSDTMPGEAPQLELVQSAIGAAVSGAELTRRLLAFARRQPLQPEQIDLNALLDDLAKLLRRTLGENVEIALDLVPTIAPVTVDRVQLETAIANLANNARDAMPNGGRLIITTRMVTLDQDYAERHAEVAPGDYVLIEVSDGGEGMPPEVQARIFEPFYTTKAPGKGTGLGLSMVFGFIKQSGGHISVYSEPGRGTTFRLYLPPAVHTAAAIAVESPPLQPAGVPRETILVVEDNAKLREIVVKQLRALGYRIFEADNAQRALDLMAICGGIDLLFTDVVLPGDMDGCSLARKVAARSPQAKVLFTSGFPGARLAEMQGMDSNARLLSKPYRKDELTRVIREVLAERPRS